MSSSSNNTESFTNTGEKGFSSSAKERNIHQMILRANRQEDENEEGQMNNMTIITSTPTPPPMYEILGAFSDDSNSVSSLSSNEEEDDGIKPRSIFSSYWDRQASRGSRGRRMPICHSSSKQDHVGPPLLVVTQLPASITGGAPSEGCPPPHQHCPSSFSPRGGTRRAIFGARCWSRSTPLLGVTPHPQRGVRKTQSSSTMSSKTLTSCLRSSRFSTTGKHASWATTRCSVTCTTTSEASVTFNTSVDVRYYEKPTESWAAEGWSDWFA